MQNIRTDLDYKAITNLESSIMNILRVFAIFSVIVAHVKTIVEEGSFLEIL